MEIINQEVEGQLDLFDGEYISSSLSSRIFDSMNSSDHGLEVLQVDGRIILRTPESIIQDPVAIFTEKSRISDSYDILATTKLGSSIRLFSNVDYTELQSILDELLLVMVKY